ncbi:MAG: class II fructose-bisphosphate aldolase [Methanobacteriota archaeon]
MNPVDHYKPVQGSLLYDALKGSGKSILAANIRFPASIRGIMEAAKELDTAVIFEIAPSELSYTRQTPKELVASIIEEAERLDFRNPFAVHADHVKVKSPDQAELGRVQGFLGELVEAGFTSFALDASPLDDLVLNASITAALAKILPQGVGLEVELSAIGAAENTRVSEAVDYVAKLHESVVFPHFLAVQNGTAHGNLYDDSGLKIPKNVDLPLTSQIIDALEGRVVLAQHGAVGLSNPDLSALNSLGVGKFNMAVNWADIVYDSLPDDVASTLDLPRNPPTSREEALSLEARKKEIAGRINTQVELGEPILNAITESTHEEASRVFNSINSVQTASIVREYLERGKTQRIPRKLRN